MYSSIDISIFANAMTSANRNCRPRIHNLHVQLRVRSKIYMSATSTKIFSLVNSDTKIIIWIKRPWPWRAYWLSASPSYLMQLHTLHHLYKADARLLRPLRQQDCWLLLVLQLPLSTPWMRAIQKPTTAFSWHGLHHRPLPRRRRLRISDQWLKRTRRRVKL